MSLLSVPKEKGPPGSAFAPFAVLPVPVVLLASAPSPVAVLDRPVVLLKSAAVPRAVLPRIYTSGIALERLSAGGRGWKVHTKHLAISVEHLGVLSNPDIPPGEGELHVEHTKRQLGRKRPSYNPRIRS